MYLGFLLYNVHVSEGGWDYYGTNLFNRNKHKYSENENSTAFHFNPYLKTELTKHTHMCKWVARE